MIVTAVISLILAVLNAIFYVLSLGHKVTTIPLFDGALLTGFGYWNAFLDEFPPLEVVWNCAVWYFGFKIILLLVKFFFGHRVNI